MPNPVNPNISEQISPDGTPTGIVPDSSPPSPVKVEAPKIETPKEEKPIEEAPKEESLVDFTQFLKVKELSEPPPLIEKKVEEKPKEEVKPPPVDIDGRDYSDFNDEEKPLFKRMSNEAFNKLKPIYLEHRKLRTEKEELSKQLEEVKKGQVRVPENYYEHPQAYVLTPEFVEASQNVDRAQLVFNHWEDQLNKIREGAKEVDILGIDDNGNFAITEKMPADVSAETKLLSYFNFAQNQLMQARASQQALVKTHNDRYKDSLSFIRGLEQKSFPLFEKEESRKSFEPLINDIISKFPAVFRNSPLSSILAKSLVTNVQLATLLQQMQNKGETSSVSPAAKIGPSLGEASGEAGNEKRGKDVTFDDFERVKQGI